jgi:D,D-heptose 1,7-bisphosphate phosphatase
MNCPQIKDVLMPRPGVLLDRDGTIIEDYHYVGHIERVQFIPGAIEAIRRFNAAGIPVAVITNQGGVARGFYSEDNVIDVHQYIQRELAKHKAWIDLFLYSPHHPSGNTDEYRKDDDWHKPNTGMAYNAAIALDLDLHESWVVGDRLTDMEMASRIRSNGVYLGPGAVPYYMSHFYRFTSLAEAATFIIERITGMSLSEFPTMRYNDIFGFVLHYRNEVQKAIGDLSIMAVSEVSDILYKAYSDGSCVWIAGNGGAAAIADHMATDHVKHMAATDTLFQNVHSLASNHAVTTALANDIGYDSIFSWQLERFGNKDDVLVVFSVSGQSANIIAALQRANEIGMKTVAILGNDGGRARYHADVAVVIPAANYGVVEDVMSIIQHTLAQYIRQTQMSDHSIQSARF